MNEALRELVVKVKTFADTSGLTSYGKNIDSVIAKVNGLGLALGAGAALYGMKRLVESGVQFGSSIVDSSRKVGLSAEEFQKWGYVAERAGVSTESVQKAMGFLNANLGEAQLGSAKAIKVFAALHIGLKNQDGTWKDTTQVINEFSDSLAALPNIAQKTDYAKKLGGKGAKELAQTFGLGSKAIEEQRKELERFGGLLDGKTASALKEHEHKILLVHKAWDVLKARIAYGMLPVLGQITEKIGMVSRFFQELEGKTGAVSFAFIAIGAAMTATLIPSFARFLPYILPFSKFLLIFTAITAVVQEFMAIFDPTKIGVIEVLFQKIYGDSETAKRMQDIRDSFQGLFDIFTNKENTSAMLELLGDMAYALEKIAEIIVRIIPLFVKLRNSIQSLPSLDKMLGNPEGTGKSAYDAAMAARRGEATPYHIARPGKRESTTTLDGVIPLSMQSPDSPGNVAFNKSSASYNSASSVTNHNTININGGNLVEVRKVIEDTINGKLIFTKEDFVTAVP